MKFLGNIADKQADIGEHIIDIERKIILALFKMYGRTFVSGKMLAGAMIQAHAATPGKVKEKQAAGISLLSKYLADTRLRMNAWNKLSALSPEKVIARASLSEKWMETAGELIEKTTNVLVRRALMSKIIDAYPKKQFVFKEAELMTLLPKINHEMVEIPAGTFKMGSLCYGNEHPVRQVSLSGFLVGKYPVTNAQYGIFMDQTGYKEPLFWNNPEFGKGKPNNPVVGVDKNDCEAYVRWLAMQLPTEAQWEYAARGPKGFEYPWGNTWDPSKITPDKMYGTHPVDAHPEGASPFGVVDMVGNIWQYTSDRYGKYEPMNLKDPKGSLDGYNIVLRGCAWYIDVPVYMRGAFRFFNNAETRDNGTGFRTTESIR